MTKEEFLNLSLKEQYSTIAQLRESLNALTKEVDKNRRENYVYCCQCKDYYKKLGAKKVVKTVKDFHLVCQDAGYGDDDVFVKTEDRNLFSVCPYCGFETYLETLYSKTIER